MRSFGTGRQCKLPGATAETPVTFNFGVPYADMVAELQDRDRHLFTRNGVLPMVERNATVKAAPERWQDLENIDFDLVITFEERVYDAVLDDLRKRAEEADGGTEPINVINLETRDKTDEAVIGAQLALDVCESVRTPALDLQSCMKSSLACARPLAMLRHTNHHIQSTSYVSVSAASSLDECPSLSESCLVGTIDVQVVFVCFLSYILCPRRLTILVLWPYCLRILTLWAMVGFRPGRRCSLHHHKHTRHKG